MSIRSQHANQLTGTISGPLSEISTNLARIPSAAMPEATEPTAAGGKLDSDATGFWKTMLSPVAEESPSPRKGSSRKPKLAEENLPPSHSRRRETVHGQHSENSPPKKLIRSLSPGSLKMQNFLRRLERQGLSHD